MLRSEKTVKDGSDKPERKAILLVILFSWMSLEFENFFNHHKCSYDQFKDLLESRITEEVVHLFTVELFLN